MQELLAFAAERRRQVDLGCGQNREETGEWNKAALEMEVQSVKDYLRQWRQSIQ